jgi:hypothetical protein
MSKTKELEAEIAKIEREITELTTKLLEVETKIIEIKKKPSQWPQERDRYFYLSSDGEILSSHWDNTPTDRGRRSIGNIFRFSEEAEKHHVALCVVAASNWFDCGK